MVSGQRYLCGFYESAQSGWKGDTELIKPDSGGFSPQVITCSSPWPPSANYAKSLAQKSLKGPAVCSQSNNSRLPRAADFLKIFHSRIDTMS